MFVTGVYGQDCPLNNVVKTEAHCRDAASQLQMMFVGRVSSSKRPAGCYVQYNGVYLNFETNPDLTSPSTDEAGICKGTAGYSIRPIYIFAQRT